MIIQLTEFEINQLLENFVPKRKLNITFTGINTFEASAEVGLGFRKMIPFHIEKVSSNTITIGYQMGTFLNTLLKWIVDLDKAEIAWDQKNRKIHIDPMALLRGKVPFSPLNFQFKNFTIQSGMFILDLELISSVNFEDSVSSL